MTDLERFRREKDRFFAADLHSQLTPEQQKTFHGLKYFPENPALRVEAPVDEFAEKEEVVMQTSTGDTQTYVRYGRFKFSVDGEPAELTIYAGPHGFFLPFVDALAGKETYGAGRYLDPEELPNGKFLIDFN